MIAGTLEIQLLANMARLQQDMNQAKSVVGDAMSGIERAAASAKMALGGIAAGLVLSAITDKAFGAIESLSKMSDMAQKTGASVENLSRILKVASSTGFDAGEIDKALIKLSKGMATVDNDTNKVNQALKALGISATDSAGKMRDPAQVYIDIANKLSTFKDSANKTAIAVDLMGKAGAQQLPFLNDIVEHIGKFAGASTEAAKQAERLTETFGVMKTKSGEAFTAFAIELMPTLERMANAFSESSKGASSFSGAARAVSIVMETLVVLGSEVSYVFKQTALEINGLYRQLVALSEVSFRKIAKEGFASGFAEFNKISKDMKEAAIAARIEHDKFIQSVLAGKKAIADATPTKNLDYLSGKEKTGTISDYEKLRQEIAKLTAEDQKRLDLGRELTTGEKMLEAAIANKASKAKDYTDANIKSLTVDLKHLDAIEKQIKANEKLAAVKKSLAEIVADDKEIARESIEKLKYENDLIGKNAEQQSKLTAAYNAQHEMRKKLADIDKKTLGIHDTVADNAAIAKLQAASDLRIKLARDEEKAKLDAAYTASVEKAIYNRTLPSAAEEVGRTLIEADTERKRAAAAVEHDAALAKIKDLDAILERVKLEADYRQNLANTSKFNEGEEMQVRADTLIELRKEANDKIKEYGADNIEFAAAALAIANDEYIIQSRMQEKLKEIELTRRAALNVELEAASAKLGVSKNQAAYDDIELAYQLKKAQLRLDSMDADNITSLGMAKQAELLNTEIDVLTKQLALNKELLDKGKLTAAQLEEQAKLHKQIAEIRNGKGTIAEKAKADLEATEAARANEANILLTIGAEKKMWAGMLTQIDTDFHNSFLLMLNNGKATWATFVKSLANTFKTQVADFIYKRFLTPIVMKMVLSLAGVVGSAGLASAATDAANASKAWSGISNIAGTITSSIDSFAQGLYFSGNELISKAGELLLNSSQVLGYAGAALAGISVGTFLAGDKKIFGLSGTVTSIIGTAIGSLFGAPFLGGVIGGLVNALFGSGPKRYETPTVRGGFSGEGFKGNINAHWSQKGGLFGGGGSGDDVTPLTDPAQKMMNGMVGNAGASFGRLISLSGDATRSVEGWNFAIDRALPDEAAVTQLFNDMADSMGTFVIPELEKFRVKGENLADTAVRLGDEYVITESIFRMMGFTAAATGIASLGMRDSLIQLMGGIQQTSSTMEAYYKNFYTADEQHINSLNQVKNAFKALGLIAPETREGFRQLAETLVKDTTPAGQALFAAVMKLNPAFAAVTVSTEDATAALVKYAQDVTDAQKAIIESAKTAVEKAFDNLKKAVQTERDLITQSYTASIAIVNASISKLTSLSSALKSSVAGLNPLGRGQAQAEIKTALLLAGMGVFPTTESMSRALQAVAQPSEKLFRTFEDYKRDQIYTSNDIEALGTLTDKQLTTEEKTLQTLNDTQNQEMERLDGILKGAQDQIDAINGVNNSVLSVVAALFALTAALTNLKNQSITTSPMQTGMGITNVNGLLTFSGPPAGDFASSYKGTPQDEIARRIALRNPSVTTAPVVTAPVITAPAFNEMDRSTWTTENWSNYRTYGSPWPIQQNNRSFAVGTDYVPYDMVANIHKGEQIVPAAYNRSGQSTNGELVAEIRELRAEVKQARIEANANVLPLVANTGKTAKKLDMWEGVGMPVSRTA